MSEAKHTRGPWTIQAYRDCCDEYAARIPEIDLCIPDEMSDEDAALIVAAPDLLASLNELIDEYADRLSVSRDEFCRETGVGRRAAAAIAKATGA